MIPKIRLLRSFHAVINAKPFNCYYPDYVISLFKASQLFAVFSFFKILLIFFSKRGRKEGGEREREREREKLMGERNICWLPLACALTSNWSSNLLLLRDNAQPTKPCWPGQKTSQLFFLIVEENPKSLILPRLYLPLSLPCLPTFWFCRPGVRPENLHF